MTAAYASDGFLVLPGVFGAAELEELLREVDGLIDACGREPQPPKELQVQWDGAGPDRAVRMIFPIVHVSSRFAELARDPRLTGFAASVLGDDDVELFEDKLNTKPPGGGDFVWHQDWSCCWRGETDQLVNCFVALESADERNGALRVVPGSHAARECLPFLSESEHFEVDPAHVDEPRAVTVPMDAGDVLVFDPYLLHSSRPNRSAGARRTVIYTYSAARVGRRYGYDDMIELRRERLGGLPDFAARG
jgi:phytanoyl-CoA hydroxylase